MKGRRRVAPAALFASGDLADAELAELAEEGRAADAEAAGDLRHAAAIMADGEADDVGLDFLEAAHVAVARVKRDARGMIEGGVLRGPVQERLVDVRGAAGE